MKIGTWNMDYWKRVCNDPNKKEYKSDEQIQNYKIETLRFIKESHYDFLLLQETNPFFYFKENSKEKWPFEIECCGKNILFQSFRGLDWGNAIVAKNKYQKNILYRDNYNDYYSKVGQMFCDFIDLNKNIVTIINIYNKCKDGIWETYYETLENIIIEIGDIIKNKNNLIILAGDFNGSKQSTENFPNGDPKYIDLFKKIENLGFINCTENIGGTVSYKDYQNDYIFIKNHKNQKVTSKKHNDNKLISFSDHYLIDCEIEL